MMRVKRRFLLPETSSLFQLIERKRGMTREILAWKGAEIIRFRHNDAKDLERRMVRLGERAKEAIIIVEGIYSMLGDVAPLAEIVDIKQTTSVEIEGLKQQVHDYELQVEGLGGKALEASTLREESLRPSNELKALRADYDRLLTETDSIKSEAVSLNDRSSAFSSYRRRPTLYEKPTKLLKSRVKHSWLPWISSERKSLLWKRKSYRW